MELLLKKHSQPGKLIVIEGMDGCGKTTVENEVAKYYRDRGLSILQTYQPTDWWRQDINIMATLHKTGRGNIVCDEAVALFGLADRINHQRKILEPELARGSIILCNRYIYSLFSYYMALGGVDLDWLKIAASFVVEPDAAILLTADPETAIDRVILREGSSSDAYDQKKPIVARIMASFVQLAERHDIHAISTECDLAATVGQCVAIIDRIL